MFHEARIRSPSQLTIISRSVARRISRFHDSYPDTCQPASCDRGEIRFCLMKELLFNLVLSLFFDFLSLSQSDRDLCFCGRIYLISPVDHMTNGTSVKSDTRSRRPAADAGVGPVSAGSRQPSPYRVYQQAIW